MAEVTGKVANAVVKVQVQNQDKIGATNATLAKTGGLLSQVGNVAGEISNKAVSAFASIHESIENAGATLTKFMGSLALLGSGAALSGISYIGAAQEKLYEEQLMKSIEANKKWGMSNADSLKKVQDQIAGANKLAYTSSGKMAASIQAAYTYGGKYARGEKGLDIAAEAEKVAFAYKPKPGEAGLVGEELVADIMRKTALRLDQKRKMAIALGVDVDNKQLDTVSGRLKLLEKQAGKIQIDLEMKAQPWKIAQGNLEKLRDQIGNSMIGPMSTLINRFSDLVDTIMKIPGASSFIGWAAIGMAAVGVFSLMITAITSVAGTLKLAAIATKVYAAAQWLLTTAKILLIGANEAEMFSQVRATGAANLGTIARIRQTAVTWAHAAATYAVSIATGVWTAAQWLLNAAMSANPLGIAILALAALAALLYLVEQKTHFFSNAWKDISKTAFVQGLIGQFSSLVGWISQGAAGLAKLGGGGALKMVLAMAVGPAMLLLKPVLMIADFLYKIFTRTDALKKLFETVVGVWNNIWNAISWISDFLAGLIDKIRSFLPSWVGGYTEEEKARKAGKKVSASEKVVTSENWTLADIEAMQKRGMTPEQIANALYPRVAPEQRPDLLASQIAHLNAVNDNFLAALKSGTVVEPSLTRAGPLPTPPGVPTPPRSPESATKGPTLPGVLIPAKGPDTYTEQKKWEQQMGIVPSSSTAYDSPWQPITAQGGATFPRGGLFFGKVHPSEEIVPQAVAQRGPGPISKAIEALSSMSLGAGRGAGQGMGQITIYNENHISVAKIEKQSDIDYLIARMSDQAADQLIFRLQNRLSSKQQREIAYMRG